MLNSSLKYIFLKLTGVLNKWSSREKKRKKNIWSNSSELENIGPNVGLQANVSVCDLVTWSLWFDVQNLQTTLLNSEIDRVKTKEIICLSQEQKTMFPLIYSQNRQKKLKKACIIFIIFLKKFFLQI